MQELLDDCHAIREICTALQEKLAKAHGPDDPRVEVFGMLFNQATICLELLSHYLSHWSPPVDPSAIADGDVDRARAENAQRCVEATSACFIKSISAIEFGIRRTIRVTQNGALLECLDRRERLIEQFDAFVAQSSPVLAQAVKPFRKNLKSVPPFDSFMRVIERSRADGLLSDGDLWTFAVRLRNAIVHNNGIGTVEDSLQLDGRVIQMRPGEMTQGKVDTFTFLLRRLVPSLGAWLRHM